MQAIGHRYLDLHPKARVRCVSAQDFINEYTSAVRESTNKTHASLEKFDERYRSLDLLLIDDVQSLSGAKGSQGQFFRAFEALVPHNKRLIPTPVDSKILNLVSYLACRRVSLSLLNRLNLKCARRFFSTKLKQWESIFLMKLLPTLQNV